MQPIRTLVRLCCRCRCGLLDLLVGVSGFNESTGVLRICDLDHHSVSGAWINAIESGLQVFMWDFLFYFYYVIVIIIKFIVFSSWRNLCSYSRGILLK